jgi:hypothetical protein
VVARFEQTSLDDVERTLGTQGLPPVLALAVSELFGALAFEEPVLFADDIVQASGVSIFQTWAPRRTKLTRIRSSLGSTNSNHGRIMFRRKTGPQCCK